MIKAKNITIIKAVVAILFSFTLVATVTTEASTQSDTTSSRSEEGSVWFDNESFVPLATVAVAGGAAITAVLTYWYNKKKDRLTQIIMPILKEYNELSDSEIAIDILDDYPYEFDQVDDPQAYYLYGGEIYKKDLPLVLRDDKWIDTSPVEDKVVKSFDALLYFFAELEYVVQIGLVKHEDLKLFSYELEKVIKQPAILNFVNIHRLSYFKGQLDPRLVMKVNKGVNILGTEKEVEQHFKRLKNAGYVPANS
jgi:hypothetical protein